MRKKQLMALLLAGTLTVSMTPYITSAEEFASEMDSSAQGADSGMAAPVEESAVIGGAEGPTDVYVEDANNAPEGAGLTGDIPAADIPAGEVPPADTPAGEEPGTGDNVAPAPGDPAGNVPPADMTGGNEPVGDDMTAGDVPSGEEPGAGEPLPTVPITGEQTPTGPVPDNTEPAAGETTPGETEGFGDGGLEETPGTPETETPSVGSGTPEDPFTDFSALKQAIENAAMTYSNGMDIYIGNLTQRELNETITVKSNIRLIVVSPTEMVRGAQMLGSFFHVESGSLEFVVNEGASLTLNGQTADGQTAAAPLIDVEKGGNLIVNSGVTLTGNTNADGAAAIDAKGITVLKGGTITGNKSSKGAVYVSGDGILQVCGSAAVTGNTSAADDSIALNTVLAEGKTLDLIAELSDGAAIGLTAEKPAEKTKIVNIAEDIFETPWNEKLFYDNASFIVDGEGFMTVPSTPTPVPTASPTPSVEATPTPTAAPEATVTPGATVTPEATVTPTPGPTATPELPLPAVAYVADSIQWNSHEEVSVKLRIQNVTVGSAYYYLIKPYDANDLADTETLLKEIKEKGIRTQVDAETDASISTSNLTDERDYVLYAYAENPSQNLESSIAVVNLVTNAASGRPGVEPEAPTTTPEPSLSPSVSPEPSVSPSPSVEPHEPVVYEASQSIVLGLEEPLEFWPDEFHQFTVIGAGTKEYYEYMGMEEPEHGDGDVKWVYSYWSTKANPREHEKERNNTTIGVAAKDYRELHTTARTYNLYVFFTKYVYEDGDWRIPEQIENQNVLKTTFSTAAFEPTEEVKNLIAKNTSGKDQNQNLNNQDITESFGNMSTATGDTAIQKKKDTKKKAVSTADEAPVGNMFLLLVASLLAGGYVITRKRIKTK